MKLNIIGSRFFFRAALVAAVLAGGISAHAQTPDSMAVAKLGSLEVRQPDSPAAAPGDSLRNRLDSLRLKIDALGEPRPAADTLAAPADSSASDTLAPAADPVPPKKVLTAKEKKKAYRDSVWAVKDSIIRNTPRVLETYVFTDTVKNQRMFLWEADMFFNKPLPINPDTTFNDWYSEVPYQRNDAGATYLGVAGSAMQYNNFFSREKFSVFPFFEPYLPYSYTPETLPFYNTKTPYTELGYWGTLFANKKKEETNIRFLHTQNITPSFNFNVLYKRYGGNGMLENERTDNRTLSLTGNYLGERYMAQGGYLYNRIKRNENGGITDTRLIRDTILEGKVIPVHMTSANTVLKRNTFFIDHSYGIPFRFLQKKDSLGRRDTLDLGEGTMAYIGHTGEISFYGKKYTDNIGLDDESGRALYNGRFFINPTQTADSMRVFQVENKVFINLQPWAKEAILSHLSAGVGHQYRSLYGFRQKFFLEGNSATHQNNLYMYFGLGGQLKKYFAWEAFGKYDFAGYHRNDFIIDGKVKFSTYPKKMKRGIHLTGKIHVGLERPNYFYNNAYTNHYRWENDFSKASETRVEAQLYIPDWKLEAFFGYSLLNNNTYFDAESIVRQNKDAMSVLSAYLKKDFRVWKFHFDHKILFQVSSNEKVVPLPKLSLDLRYYLEVQLVKNVLTAQIGANGLFTTKYYMQGYSPALGVFFNQDKEKFGSCPYLDLFVNLQWKRAGIFVKFVNMAEGKMTDDYFSAANYIRPQKSLKFGIYWPFYIK